MQLLTMCNSISLAVNTPPPARYEPTIAHPKAKILLIECNICELAGRVCRRPEHSVAHLFALKPDEQPGYVSGLSVFWRKKGPLGKLHNTLAFIRKAPQRRENLLLVLMRCQALGTCQYLVFRPTWRIQLILGLDLMVILHNSTRWNSTLSIKSTRN